MIKNKIRRHEISLLRTKLQLKTTSTFLFLLFQNQAKLPKAFYFKLQTNIIFFCSSQIYFFFFAFWDLSVSQISTYVVKLVEVFEIDLYLMILHQIILNRTRNTKTENQLKRKKTLLYDLIKTLVVYELYFFD
jgi:hypothetical protein